MARRSRLRVRWLSLVLTCALLASGVVVYALVHLTDPTAATPAVDPTAGTSDSTGAAPGVMSYGVSSAPTDRAPTTPRTATLPGSTLTLPVAWSGTAEMTITVHGKCAGHLGTSRYSVPVDVALDLPRTAERDATGGNPATLTIGVNSAKVPALSVLSASADDQGDLHRYWSVSATGAVDGRTELQGTLINAAAPGGRAVNMLIDSETALQPCDNQADASVRPPRALANGSALSGWVSGSQAHLVLRASTADGQRAITVTIDARHAAG